MSQPPLLPTREGRALSNVHRLEPVPAHYVTREQIAVRLGVSVDTIDRMRKTQGLPSIVLSKRTRRFDEAEVLAWARRTGRMAA